jgi:hypothetical protein
MDGAGVRDSRTNASTLAKKADAPPIVRKRGIESSNVLGIIVRVNHNFSAEVKHRSADAGKTEQQCDFSRSV